jgi:hypothetical protein
MLRKIAVVGFVLALVGPVAAPAGAKPAPLASGPFTGTTSYTFVTDGCSFVHQVYDATVGSNRNPTSSFHLAGCVTLSMNSDGFPYSGTFTIRTRGGTLTGTVAGGVHAEILPCSPFRFTLTVTGGTQRLRHTSGTITVAGTWCERGDVPAVNDPISGDLTASLTG